MKRTKLLSNIIGSVVAAGLLASASFGQGITGSDHDFSSKGWSGGEICLPCHTPHNSNTTVTNAPLWNHELTTATYTLYDGTSGVTTANALDGFSILCMSCHDGTVALDSYGNQSGNNFIGGSELIGTDLQNDHPVGATGIYPTSGFTEFTDPSTWEGQTGDMNLQDWLDGNSVVQRVVSCTTCHEPHNEFGNIKFLRRSNSGSALCLTCHLK